MQELTLELAQLRCGEHSATDVKAKEQALELLHWRLARVARQTATDELGITQPTQPAPCGKPDRRWLDDEDRSAHRRR